jgi:hypothetical protein
VGTTRRQQGGGRTAARDGPGTAAGEVEAAFRQLQRPSGAQASPGGSPRSPGSGVAAGGAGWRPVSPGMRGLAGGTEDGAEISGVRYASMNRRS